MIGIYSGIYNITNNITDIFELKARNKTNFTIHLAARLNGAPHLGTLVNFATGFILASRLKSTFHGISEVNIDLIDNISDLNQCKTLISDGSIYFLKEGVYNNSVLRKNQDKFISLLEKLSVISGISYHTENYQEIQADQSTRKGIIEVINDNEYFGYLFQPTNKILHYRTPCPVCGLIEKTAMNTGFESYSNQGLLIRGKCPLHGEHEISFTPDNDSYIDINIPFRNFCKGLSVVDKDASEDSMSVIVRGNDWSGIWPLRIYCEGLLRLNRTSLPNFLFSPLILHQDEKLSKSRISGSNIFEEFADTSLLTIEQIETITKEMNYWFDDANRFFTNYAIAYFYKTLKKKSL